MIYSFLLYLRWTNAHRLLYCRWLAQTSTSWTRDQRTAFLLSNSVPAQPSFCWFHPGTPLSVSTMSWQTPLGWSTSTQLQSLTVHFMWVIDFNVQLFLCINNTEAEYTVVNLLTFVFEGPSTFLEWGLRCTIKNSWFEYRPRYGSVLSQRCIYFWKNKKCFYSYYMGLLSTNRYNSWHARCPYSLCGILPRGQCHGNR